MQAKRLLSCGFAFLFVLAFAGVASALDVSDTRGTWVRIEQPADGAYAAIGDTVIVAVHTVSGATAVTVSVVAPDDTNEPADADSNPDVVGGGSPVYQGTVTGIDALTADVDLTFSAGVGNSVTLPEATDDVQDKIIKVYFVIAADNTDVQRKGLSIGVTVAGTGSAAGTIYNTTVDEQILPGATGYATTPIGDGNTFGIDNKRPVNTEAFIEMILVDSDGTKIKGAEASTGAATDLVGGGLTLDPDIQMIKEGDDVSVSLRLNTGNVIDANATVATVIFVKETLVGDDPAVADLVTGAETTLMDSAITMVTFTDLFATQPLVKSLDTSEGVFGDGLRVRAFGFLQDEAGNLGGTAANVANPSGDPGLHHVDDDDDPETPENDDLTGDDLGGTTHTAGDTNLDPQVVNLFLIDTTTPTVTVAYPKSGAVDSTHLSAATTQSLKYYSDSDGTLGPVGHAGLLKHLTLKVSEDVESVTIKHGDSTMTVDRSSASDTDNFDLALLEDGDPVWNYADGEAGISKTLTVSATDEAGNEGSAENEGITYDPSAPVLSDVFPSEGNAPKDDGGRATITSSTRHPLFNANEPLDSLSVRYVQRGASPPDFAHQSFSAGDVLTQTGKLATATVQDTLLDGVDYYLQLVAVDFAGNASVTTPQLLRFTKEFMNPVADTFAVATAVDDLTAVVAGAALSVNITALDSSQTAAEGDDVRAVTYRGASRVRVMVSDDQADRLEGVSFEGDNVEIATADTGMGIATLNPDGWRAATRSVDIKSEMTLSDVMVVVEDLNGDGDVAFSTSIGPFSIDAAIFNKFSVVAMEDGEATDNVIGEFQVSVTATDEFGNPSMKIGNTIDSELDTDDHVNADGIYKTIAIEFASNNSQVSVPSGRQEIEAGANIFDASASAGSGTATIGVFSDDPEGSGSVMVSFGPPAPPPAPGAPAAPASLIVEDYRGPSGDGDQGGIVMVTFPNSADHATVDKYQIFREISVTATAEDSAGNLVALDDSTMMAWVPWAALESEDPNADVQRAVIPALDNVPTNWAVAAIGTGGSSDQTPATAKRVFTKESVQQTLELLGMPEAELLTYDELLNQFNAPEDYVKSILGDQKNLVFAPVNPDVSVLVGNASVPSNIRTSSDGGRLASERTATEKPVGAVDNIAPAAATDGAGTLSSDGETAQVGLSWTVSADEGIVGFIPYRNELRIENVIPIYGVKGYDVLRGASEDALESIGTVDYGSTEFVDTNLPEGRRNIMYRIDAFDDNNNTPGELITVQNLQVRAKFADANGDPVYLMVLPPAGNVAVDFEDFIAFAAAFGSQKGDANFNVQADVNDDGMVDFSDFLTASASFGRVVAAPLNKLAVVPQRPGLNADTEMSLELASDKVLVGETISLTVSMANASALNGYGLELVYDADKFEFVSAAPAEKDLLKTDGGETPLFKNWPEEGRVSVVNAIVESGSVSGEGALVTFTFKVLREFEDSARFEIAQGVVFDPNKLQNPVVTLGALDVQSTPTEFALHQNYPNPFNPQTNIPYDLAEGGDVVLRIYNLLGQEVRTLVHERQAPGRYMVQWSGMDDRGVSVSSGIYFYQVSVAGKFQDAKRLMLLK
jgi:hypothetical protein